jgi:hypothetical protein
MKTFCEGWIMRRSFLSDGGEINEDYIRLSRRNQCREWKVPNDSRRRKSVVKKRGGCLLLVIIVFTAATNPIPSSNFRVIVGSMILSWIS